jgi:hypothetical protein
MLSSSSELACPQALRIAQLAPCNWRRQDGPNQPLATLPLPLLDAALLVVAVDVQSERVGIHAAASGTMPRDCMGLTTVEALAPQEPPLIAFISSSHRIHGPAGFKVFKAFQLVISWLIGGGHERLES